MNGISEEKIFDAFTSSFLKRMIAWLIDQVILGGIVAAFIYLRGGMTFDYLEIIQYTVLLNVAYYTVWEGTLGRSIGKMALDIMVLEESGEKLSFTSALFRRIGAVIPIFSLLDAGAILATSKNQRIFDIIAGTIVIEGENEEEALDYLKNGNLPESLTFEEKYLGSSNESAENQRDHNMLENLKKKKENLSERKENGELEEKEYYRLKQKYDSRISEIEERLKTD